MTQIQVYKTRSQQHQSISTPRRSRKCTYRHYQVRYIYHLLAKMLNILKRNPAELCSVLLLLAGLGQASPVDLKVRSLSRHNLA
jgi:hypothetical protein